MNLELIESLQTQFQIFSTGCQQYVQSRLIFISILPIVFVIFSDDSKDFHTSQSTIGRENATDVSSISTNNDYTEKV